MRAQLVILDAVRAQGESFSSRMFFQLFEFYCRPGATLVGRLPKFKELEPRTINLICLGYMCFLGGAGEAPETPAAPRRRAGSRPGWPPVRATEELCDLEPQFPSLRGGV